jgi:hypothetical protein
MWFTEDREAILGIDFVADPAINACRLLEVSQGGADAISNFQSLQIGFVL